MMLQCIASTTEPPSNFLKALSRALTLRGFVPGINFEDLGPSTSPRISTSLGDSHLD